MSARLFDPFALRDISADPAFSSSAYCARVYVTRFGKSDANRREAWSSSND
jgi:hypothetical protein